MKKILLLLILCTTLHANAQQYLFFLHNAFLELQGEEGVHPEYGKAEYSAIKQKFSGAGFVVISELRKRGTDAHEYAEKVSKQVDSLLKKGVKAKDITILGTSKGSYIAMCVSGLQKNKQLNFVFIGCCGEDMLVNDRLRFYGNVLSIYEETDSLGRSCNAQRKQAGDKVVRYKEIELHTGKKHGFLYKPLDEWIEPAVKWAKQDYK